MFSVGNRLLAVAISFVSVPLTVGYLGPERYGAWISIGSMLAWLQLADLGLGNGLTNAITASISKEQPDRLRVYVSSGIAALICASLLMAAVGAMAWPYINWGQVLGVDDPGARSEVGVAVALAFIFSLISFPLSLIGRIYLAFQRGVVAGYWGAANNVASLLALLIVVRANGGLPLLVFANAGVGMLTTLASGISLFVHHHPEAAPTTRHVSFTAIREVLGTGAMFFLIQILSLLVFQTDNLVIAHFRGAAAVAPYNMVYKLFGYTTLLQTLAFSYIWVAFGDAIARGDIAWVRKAFHASIIGGTMITAAAVVPLSVAAVPFVHWWTGGMITPPADLVLWMASWSVINAFTQPVASLLAAASHLRSQFIYSSISAVINLALSIWLVQIWGPTGVIAGTVIAYLSAICLPCFVDAELLLKRLSLQANES